MRGSILCAHCVYVRGSECQQLEWEHQLSQGPICLGATSCKCRCAREHVIHSKLRARRASEEVAWEQGEGMSEGKSTGLPEEPWSPAQLLEKGGYQICAPHPH